MNSLARPWSHKTMAGTAQSSASRSLNVPHLGCNGERELTGNSRSSSSARAAEKKKLNSRFRFGTEAAQRNRGSQCAFALLRQTGEEGDGRASARSDLDRSQESEFIVRGRTDLNLRRAAEDGEAERGGERAVELERNPFASRMTS